jgi:hypothetical protein
VIAGSLARRQPQDRAERECRTAQRLLRCKACGARRKARLSRGPFDQEKRAYSLPTAHHLGAYRRK